MAHKTVDTSNDLSVTRVTRTVYFFIMVYGLSIIIFDAGNLITPEAVMERWSLLVFLLLLNTFVWYASVQSWPLTTKRAPIPLLTLGLLVLAGLMTYWERGMASTSTLLYALPLLVAATQKNRHGLIATAIFAIATYAFAAIKYFNDFFNEGYRVQLYGNILFIAGCIFTVTWLIMIISGLRKDSV